jgi:transposase
MAKQINIISERIDDIVLLLHVLMQMRLPQLLNQHLPRHPNQEGLDWGWVAVIWLSYILSEGDHRKVNVRGWVREHKHMLEMVCELELRDTDFTDDRLAIVLRQLSKSEVWQAIEQQLNQNTIRIYQLPTDLIRLDSTTVSGHHLVNEEGLFQFGYSKDDPSLPQVKLMQGCLDPLGMPLATQVLSGQQADDGLYVPMFEQLQASLATPGLLWVGDCKMSALATRAAIQSRQHYYLTVLPRTNTTVELIETTLAQVQTPGNELLKVTEFDPKAGEVVVATGYQFSRQQQDETATTLWDEQVLLVHSDNYQRQQQRGFEQRLQRATDQLYSLTPTVGRGKRQICQEPVLITKAQAIVKQYRLEGMLHYSYECQTHPKTGKVRYQITSVVLKAQAIAQHQQLFGWRAYVTNAPLTRLSFADAVLTYRDEWIIERGFGRYKGKALSVSPLFVKRDDQVQGLLHLLSLGLRVLTLIEFVVRRRLQQTHQKLSGLYPDKPTFATSRPSAERLLKAFDNLTLTVFDVDNQVYGHVSPLSDLQRQILSLLGLPTTIYSDLIDDSG